MSLRIAPKPALQLGLLALLSAGLLAGLNTLTCADIQHNRALRNAQLLAQVAPPTSQPAHPLTLTLGGQEQRLWQLIEGEEVVAVVLEITASGGYSGNIELLVGIDNQHRISGVRVTRHRETPGLGDKIDTRRSAWIDSFAQRSLAQPRTEHWAVKKDGGVFDQFTGATVTPRAVVNAVRDALSFSHTHRHSLYQTATPSEQP